MSAIDDMSLCAAAAVPRHLVHKAANSEVLPTGWTTTGQDAYVVTAQWPRTHSFYRPLRGRHDPLLFVETVRQIIPLLSHVAYDVPFDHRLIWDTFSFTVEPDHLGISPLPTEVALHVSCQDVKRRRESLSSLTLHAEAVADGVSLGTATARFTSKSPAVYSRLRAGRDDLAAARTRALPPRPGIPPAAAARRLPEDVVLAPGARPGSWYLRADLDHPALFDHPVDHVPGMLVIEAARQAAQASCAPGDAVEGMRTTFHRYVELDAPGHVVARPLTANTLSITVEQHGGVCFQADVTMRGTEATANAA